MILVPLLSSAALNTVFYPWSYAKVLIQIGHEPVDPVNSTTIFGSKVLRYPNAITYARYIRKVDGFTGMYRGLGPRLISGMLFTTVQQEMNKRLKPKKTNQAGEREGYEEIDGDEEDDEGLLELFKDMGIEMASRTTAVIVSHPFHVIMVRSIAQFIGREKTYNDSFSAISEIYNKEGLSGFFAGVVPRILGEIASIWLTSSISYVLVKYVIKKDNKMLSGNAIKAVVSVLTASLTYPFTVVSNTMCINNCGLAAGQVPIMPVYDGWRDCWGQLSKENGLKRGANMFNRYYTGKTISRSDGSLVPAVPLFIY